MPTSAEKIAQMELALAQARAEYERENGKRFEIIMREISPDEKQRILDSLTDRQERILFGLEVAVERVRPGTSGGDLTCPHCGDLLVMCNSLAWDKTGQTLDRVLSVASRPGRCSRRGTGCRRPGGSR